jgi:hypothetical protein
MILSLVVSTIAFFAASYFIKRRFDEMDLPKGMTRNVTIFVLALAIAYGAAGIVGMITGS